ncbi:LOW QUALITY PROTEIN: hypothetical protein Cgig2_011748 [Carnegiea gigantea]|uniref:Uncharacterized protein n=1 Tax=Carnegiea gigantea TaxID=171969 RepID=A0A9Q1KL52_9CARY|nr:LOW QUALITY PROTEIN: hypothetical protein Cgig2_011748 [Carnegiea gigantea]
MSLLWDILPSTKRAGINAHKESQVPYEEETLKGSLRPNKRLKMLIIMLPSFDQPRPCTHPKAEVSDRMRNTRNPQGTYKLKRKSSFTGQLNHFLRRRKKDEYDRRNLKERKDNDVDWETEVIATITGGVDEKKLKVGYHKAQIRKPIQVMLTKELNDGPIMTFGLDDMCPLQRAHNDALVIQLKIVTSMV